MTEKRWISRAPSNIALVKYMGKKDSNKNIPENPSISLTLNQRCSVVELTSVLTPGGGIQWVSEVPDSTIAGIVPAELSVPGLREKEIEKLANHFKRVQRAVPEIFAPWDLTFDSRRGETEKLVIKSANTFPTASGIASSASSFAALTLAMAAFFSSDEDRFLRVWEGEPEFRRRWARISREGSGSSCRSFEGPWVYWDEEKAEVMDSSGTPEVVHFVVLIHSSPKTVSSTDAHRLIRTSPLWGERPERVRRRAEALTDALRKGNWAILAHTAWREAWEMHSLFHTSADPFSYWTSGTIDALHWFTPWVRSDSPPIVTLDAGPNVHVIVEKAHREIWRARLRERFQGYSVLEDEQGGGPGLWKVTSEGTGGRTVRKAQ